MARRIIKHCAPTLAGLKIGSAFSCECISQTRAEGIVASLNAKLNRKGVFVKLLYYKNGRALFYVYRASKLQAVLASKDIYEFLYKFGYASFNAENCINVLISRIISNGEFPHELGIFLGYPLNDIKSFIENSGNNALCVGCWKVYHDVDSARETFCKYSKCTRIYMQKFESGVDLIKLTVAC